MFLLVHSILLPGLLITPQDLLTIPPLLSQDHLVTSRRPKVLFIADAIGQNVDITHLEDTNNSHINTESVFEAAMMKLLYIHVCECYGSTRGKKV
jgi:hypothetical protein